MMTFAKTATRVLCSLSAVGLLADQVFPRPGWTDEMSPLASPYAVVGGEISILAGPTPKSLNYYLDNNTLTAELFGAMYESLLGMDPITLEDEPGLAEKWSISDDKLTFTFWIDKKARWSDGKPLTAFDVKWTFEAIMNPKNMTGVHKVSLEKFETPEVVDDRTIRFVAKEVHWRNLRAVGGMSILPKHAFEALDFNKINFEFPVMSGLYRLGEFKENMYVTLERRGDWWNKDAPSAQGTGNFQTMKFRFFAERENAFEAFKKGMIDLYPVYTSHLWVKETQIESVRKNWIVKQNVHNYNPVGFQGFAMNTRRPPFDDVKVRKAMCHLLNREKMNETLMYSQYFMHRSFYEDLYDKDHPCPNELIKFDKEAARKLLAEAGWQVNPEMGLLEKNGRVFRFKFLTRSQSTDKFLTIYSEDLRDVGIELVTDRKDWASWAGDMDEFNYEMTWAAWSAGVFKDPEGMWRSSEAERKGGNNITGFKSARVDELIEKQKTIFDVDRRHEIVREVDHLIYEQYPYVLLWNIANTRLLYWNKFGMPDTVLSKYGDESSAYSYWWLDEDSEADLEAMQEDGKALPARPAEIKFDDVFRER